MTAHRRTKDQRIAAKRARAADEEARRQRIIERAFSMQDRYFEYLGQGVNTDDAMRRAITDHGGTPPATLPIIEDPALAGSSRGGRS